MFSWFFLIVLCNWVFRCRCLRVLFCRLLWKNWKVLLLSCLVCCIVRFVWFISMEIFCVCLENRLIFSEVLRISLWLSMFIGWCNWISRCLVRCDRVVVLVLLSRRMVNLLLVRCVRVLVFGVVCCRCWVIFLSNWLVILWLRLLLSSLKWFRLISSRVSLFFFWCVCWVVLCSCLWNNWWLVRLVSLLQCSR